MADKISKYEKKLEKIQRKEQKIREKINKKAKNYQERDDKEQMIRLLDGVYSGQEEIENAENYKKIDKKTKKILKNQKKLQKKANYSRFKLNQEQQEYIVDSGAEPFTERQSKREVASEIRRMKKEERRIFKEEQNKNNKFAPNNISETKDDELYQDVFPEPQQEIKHENNFVNYQSAQTKEDELEKIVDNGTKSDSKDNAPKKEQGIEDIQFNNQEDKSAENDTQKAETIVFVQRDDNSKKQDSHEFVDKKQNFDKETSKKQDESVKLEQINTRLERKNKELEQENKKLRAEKNGFLYYEELGRVKENREKDAKISQLQAERDQQRESLKKQEQEEQLRQEKVNDIVRQRKDINYEIERLEGKVQDWIELSQAVYAEAMLYMTTNLLNNTPERRFLGIPYSTILQGFSLGAMAASVGYQKDLAREREKLLQKDKELQRLLQK